MSAFAFKPDVSKTALLSGLSLKYHIKGVPSASGLIVDYDTVMIHCNLHLSCNDWFYPDYFINAQSFRHRNTALWPDICICDKHVYMFSHLSIS